MTPERGVYTGGPARSFRPIAHSRQRQPYRWEKWPPHGWTQYGLDMHWERFRVARSLLVILADPSSRDMDTAEARAAEARQFGENAVRAIADAHEAVMALTNITNVETREIDMRHGKETA